MNKWLIWQLQKHNKNKAFAKKASFVVEGNTIYAKRVILSDSYMVTRYWGYKKGTGASYIVYVEPALSKQFYE